MTRQLIIAATFAITAITSATAQADCGSHGCRTYYGQYTARQVYVLFQQRPALMQRFPQIAREVQTQFGAIPSTVAATPAAPIAATPGAAIVETPIATDPVPAAVQTPVIADSAPAAVQIPDAAPPVTSIPQAATPAEAPVTDGAPEITDIADVDANGFPVDLPFEDPSAEL